MGALLLSVSAIIVSFSFLLAGNSLQSVVLGLRAGVEGFSPTVVGIMMAFYFAGFAIGSIAAPRVIARVGYIRAFAAFRLGRIRDLPPASRCGSTRCRGALPVSLSASVLPDYTQSSKAG